MKVLAAYGAVLFAFGLAEAQTCDQVVAAVAQNARNPTGLEAALEPKTVLNCRAQNGDTPLATAMRLGSVDAVRTLLLRGADPNMPLRPTSGDPPLLSFLRDRAQAVDQAQLGTDPIPYAVGEVITWLLISAGAQIGGVDGDGVGSLSYAIAWGSERVIRDLLSRGADPQKPDAAGRTPLMYSVLSRSIQIVKLLLTLKADVNARSTNGDSALLYASDKGTFPIVQVLVAAGADVRVRNREGVTPLVLAARANDLASVQLLLQRGADPNEASSNVPSVSRGFTRVAPHSAPLLSAAEHGNDRMMAMLVAAGARARVRDGRGRTPREVALVRGQEAIAKALAEIEQREFTLVPGWALPERVALYAISQIARTSGSRESRKALDPELLRRVEGEADLMNVTWRPPKDAASRPAVFAWSLTTLVNALEWAVQTGDNQLLRNVADDLSTKREDCRTRPDGLFGHVDVSVRAVRPDGTEQRGVQVRYLERFFWDLIDKVPAVANQWREFARVTTIMNEPLAAGDYVIVARSPAGKDLSDVKPISISRNRPVQFDLVLR